MPVLRLEEVNKCSIKMFMSFQFLECLISGGGVSSYSQVSPWMERGPLTISQTKIRAVID